MKVFLFKYQFSVNLMNIPIKLIFVFLFLSNIICNSQNLRDKIIRDSILPILNSTETLDIGDYNKVKKKIEFLEKEYGFETGLKKRLIEKSFLNGDIVFFKKQLSILTEKYGFDVSYMNENENYYTSIMVGNLSKWFKKMYLKKHTIWLKHNFEKQIDLRKLNEINTKDKILASLYVKVKSIPDLDSVQQNKVITYFNDSYFQNIIEIYAISKRNNFLPNEKNFAVIQNNYNNAIIHNFIENLDRTWGLLFPYFKEAYLNNEIDYVVFKNYDFYCYLKHGYTEFNSYTIDQIPQEFRKNNNDIPLKNNEWYEKIKKEFKWY